MYVNPDSSKLHSHVQRPSKRTLTSPVPNKLQLPLPGSHQLLLNTLSAHSSRRRPIWIIFSSPVSFVSKLWAQNPYLLWPPWLWVDDVICTYRFGQGITSPAKLEEPYRLINIVYLLTKLEIHLELELIWLSIIFHPFNRKSSSLLQSPSSPLYRISSWQSKYYQRASTTDHDPNARATDKCCRWKRQIQQLHHHYDRPWFAC